MNRKFEKQYDLLAKMIEQVEAVLTEETKTIGGEFPSSYAWLDKCQKIGALAKTITELKTARYSLSDFRI